MQAAPRVSVLTVNYRSAEDVAGLAESLRDHAGVAAEMIVTNNSPDEPLPLVSDERLPIVVRDAPNVGYARGINLAMSRASGDVLMIANPDVRVTPGALPSACDHLAAHADVGVLLPLLRYPNGDIQASTRRFYNWPIALYARLPLRVVWHPSFFRRYLMEDLDRSEPIDVDWGLGGAMFIRRAECRPFGVFDPRFFMYFEDVDLCLETWRSGRRVVYCPSIICTHAHRRHSANPISRAGLRHLRSMIAFLRKHRGWGKIAYL